MNLKADIALIQSKFKTDGPVAASKATLDALAWRLYPPKRQLAKHEQAQLLRDQQWDVERGVSTCGEVALQNAGLSPVQAASGNNVYRPVHSDVFINAMKRLPVDVSDHVFLDYGSGKGKALLLASEFPFKKIIGIEYAASLHADAERNIKLYRSSTQRCRDLCSVLADAEGYAPPNDPLVCFFFNPFGEDMFAKVLRNLSRCHQTNRRNVFVVYVNHRNVAEKMPMFKRETALKIVSRDKNIAVFEFL